MSQSNFNPRAISDRGMIESLASPVRLELVDTLAAFGGEATVAGLADQLGRHADGLYYHLRVLERAGLIVEASNAHTTERVYRLAGDVDGPLRLRYKTGPDDNRDAIAKYLSGLVKITDTDIKAALSMDDVVVDGKARELWAARNKGWVSQQDLLEINRLLERLCTLTSHVRRSEDDRLINFSFALSPAKRKSRRRPASS